MTRNIQAAELTQAALYYLILGPIHIVLLPIAWAVDGRDGTDTVIRRFWEEHPRCTQ